MAAFNLDDIRTYDDFVLLRTFAALTHRLTRSAVTKKETARSRENRAQRQVVQDEIERRMSALVVLRDIVGDHCEVHDTPEDGCSYCEGVALVLASEGGL
jgi:hypothetical protein